MGLRLKKRPTRKHKNTGRCDLDRIERPGYGHVNYSGSVDIPLLEGLTMADSTQAIVSESKPRSHKTFWLFVIAVAAVLVTTVLLLPNTPNVFGGYSTRQLAYLLAVFY